jgi:putative serine protease PepD
VAEDSPAGRAGLASGDLIVAAAGRPLRNVDDLFGALRSAAPGSTIEMTVLRGTDERSIQVTLAQPEADA